MEAASSQDILISGTNLAKVIAVFWNRLLGNHRESSQVIAFSRNILAGWSEDGAGGKLAFEIA